MKNILTTTITIILLLAQFIFSLNSANICSSTTVCKGKYRYQCTQDLCTINLNTCNDYNHLLQKSDAIRTMDLLKKYIQTCESKVLSNNIKNEIDWIKQGFKSFKQKTI
jgi:hypothetical protein